MKSTSLIVLLLLAAKIGQSQILMALIFGDKLNSDKLEFGLTLGNNFSTQTNFADTKWRARGWNVGLFFNWNFDKKGRWYFHPGAIPKSTLGFRYLPTYATGDAKIDAVIDSFNFEVERKVNYIHVPLLVRYKILSFERESKKGEKKKQSFFIQAGPQISLRTKAKDIFFAELDEDNTITFENDLRDEIRRFDVSISAGLVWKFKKLIELDVSYNQGFLDIDKEEAIGTGQVGGTNRNQFVMVNVNIPVGGGKNKNKAETGTTGEKQAPAEKEPKPKKEKKGKEK